MTKLKAQLIIDYSKEQVIDIQEEHIEFEDCIITEKEIEEIMKGNFEIELEKRQFTNVKENLALMLEIIDQSTKVIYDYPPRRNFEIYGGYKIAKIKQRNFMSVLRDVKIFNLYFRFKSKKIDAIGTTAMMYRPESAAEEWIILFPDDTAHRCNYEITTYKEIALSMLFDSNFNLDPDYQSFILENLKLLTVNERCAQSIMHEYGHVLHWRMFDYMNFVNDRDIYEWFLRNGYVENVSRRSPEYSGASLKGKLYILKESLVEDYRIWLNRKQKNDMFILPNINTYFGDFLDPTLLDEGVTIMRDMLDKAITGQAKMRTKKISQEPNRVQSAYRIYETAKRMNWTPSKSTMTIEDHYRILEEFEKLNEENLVAN